MNSQHAMLILAGTMMTWAAGPAGLACIEPDTPEYNALSPDRRVADAAIATLREVGPEGLQQLIAEWPPEMLNESWVPEADKQRLIAALDAVGGQHDNEAARLYWYTDLAKAQAAAKASGRPILSLRLLGRLDDELSCANSRFM